MTVLSEDMPNTNLQNLLSESSAAGNTTLTELCNAVLAEGPAALALCGDWSIRRLVAAAIKADALQRTQTLKPRRADRVVSRPTDAHPWAHDEE